MWVAYLDNLLISSSVISVSLVLSSLALSLYPILPWNLIGLVLVTYFVVCCLSVPVRMDFNTSVVAVTSFWVAYFFFASTEALCYSLCSFWVDKLISSCFFLISYWNHFCRRSYFGALPSCSICYCTRSWILFWTSDKIFCLSSSSTFIFCSFRGSSSYL